MENGSVVEIEQIYYSLEGNSFKYVTVTNIMGDFFA